jgi:hypothetical protein
MLSGTAAVVAAAGVGGYTRGKQSEGAPVGAVGNTRGKESEGAAMVAVESGPGGGSSTIPAATLREMRAGDCFGELTAGSFRAEG